MFVESEGPPTSTPVKPSVEPCIVESPIVGCQEQSPVKCSLDGSTGNNLTTPHGKYKKLYNSAIQLLNADDSISDDSDADSEEMDLNFTESNPSDDESLLEDVNTLVEESDVEMSTEDVPCVEDRPECGPHCKLSRGEDLFKFRKEVKLAKESLSELDYQISTLK